MLYKDIEGVPDFECEEYAEKKTKYCVCMKNGKPVFPQNLKGKPPRRPSFLPESCFMSCLLWLNWFMSRLTSCTEVPLPLAMRLRRLALSRSGLERSSFVMERTMALVRASAFSSIWMLPSLLAPGIIFRISSMEPMDCI